MKKAYQTLAEYYDEGEWGSFSLKYLEIIQVLKSRFNRTIESILDISCGTGSLIHELSREYEVVGSDISEDMIRVAAEKYPDLTFVVSHMADLKWKSPFDLIISAFDSMNYLTDREHLSKSLRNIKGLLTEKGHFLFDFNTVRFFEDLHHGIFERNTDNIYFKQICEYDSESKIAKTIFDFGGMNQELHIQKGWQYEDMLGLLRDAGYEVLYSHDMLKMEPVQENSYKILILAG